MQHHGFQWEFSVSLSFTIEIYRVQLLLQSKCKIIFFVCSVIFFFCSRSPNISPPLGYFAMVGPGSQVVCLLLVTQLCGWDCRWAMIFLRVQRPFTWSNAMILVTAATPTVSNGHYYSKLCQGGPKWKLVPIEHLTQIRFYQFLKILI